MAPYKYKKEYDLPIRVGDRIRCRARGQVYQVKDIRFASRGVIMVGCADEDLDGIQDVFLDGDRDERRIAAAVNGCIMSVYWERL
jgi:hypothetical protein